MKKSNPHLRHPGLLQGLPLILLLIFAGGSMVSAQSMDAQEKIRLLSEALRARDEGNLLVAKANLEQLVGIAPEDESIQRLLAAVNDDLKRRLSGSPPLFGQASNEDPQTLLGTTPTLGNPTNSPRQNAPRTLERSDPSRLTALEVESLLKQAEADQEQLIAQAEQNIQTAQKQIREGNDAAANATLQLILTSLPTTRETASLRRTAQDLQKDLLLEQSRAALDSGRVEQAQALLLQYENAHGPSPESDRLQKRLDRLRVKPGSTFVAELDPEYRAELEQIETRLVVARAGILNGNYDRADEVLKEILLIDPTNLAAKFLRARLAQDLSSSSYMTRPGTRREMLNEVGQSWSRPLIIEKAGREEIRIEEGNPILEKLNKIVIPRVTFNGELSRVIDTLSELSVQYDSGEVEDVGPGVNIVLIDPSGQDPKVNISLRNLSLSRILEFVTKQVNYQYDVDQDAVIVSRGDSSGGNTSLVTEFFPISRATVIRLTGFRNDQGPSQAAPVDPFAPAPQSQAQSPTVNEEEEALMSFFSRAGIPFEDVGTGPPGSTLAFDGTQLIVTQTTRNLERLRNILRRYDQTKQVEIEAKFLEVQQGDLEELGFEWGLFSGGRPVLDPETGNPVLDSTGRPVLQYDTSGRTANRSISSAFSIDPEAASINISSPVVGNNGFPSLPPSTPNSVDLASDVVNSIFGRTAIIDGDRVEVQIRALARKTGSDLLSSPRLTVLSGKTASIVVAQELLYPTQYGDIQLPSPGGSREGSVSTIAIAAGTPQDFEKRNVGVEMEVTPTVEDNDNISLLLEPKVTEFEGFVEYGGPSVAVGGDGTVVTVPSGFFQPIFSTREVRTEVTIYDGATVVIGGLVREEIKDYEDKVPVLGDIPFIGRLFTSKGETAQKRNLMIFVTANLISPGGSPSRQRMDKMEPNTLFQNPMLLTPGGSVDRNPENE